MSRLMIASLMLVFVFSSGCATVRDTYSACLPTHKTNNHIDNYSPSPVFDSQQGESLPVLDLEEEIPPPPPAKLDTSWFNAKPIRKPVLPPMKDSTVRMKDSTVRWSKNIVEKFKS